jgi:hypothetical protein
VRQRVIRILGNGLLEISPALDDRLRLLFVQEVAALQVEVVGFLVLRVAFRQPLFFFAGQLDPQLVADLPGDLLPDRLELARLSTELPSPELGAILRAHQVDLHHQTVATLHHFAHQHRADAQILSHFCRVDRLVLVSERRGAGNYSELGELGEAVDELLSQAIAQVFRVRI